MPKAFIMNIDTGERIEVMFNPKEYTVAKTNSWRRASTSGTNLPDTRFSTGQPAKLTVQLFFDTYEQLMDVRMRTEKVSKLMEVNHREEGESEKKRPPKLKFHWGLTWSFTCVITSMTTRYTLFLPTGTPVRATMDVSFEEIEEAGLFPGQNPTSGGAAGRRSHVVEAGETLDWIAYKELGDSKQWRRIAETNAIVDPLGVAPGTVLVVEPEA